MIGLMWADKYLESYLQQCVIDAVKAYYEKHGRWPTVCQVRPLDEMPETIKLEHGGSVRITAGPMPRYHLLIGENGTEADHADA